MVYMYCFNIVRDLVIAELQKQIDDLTLLLEEDRLNHRTSMRKVTNRPVAGQFFFLVSPE